MLRADIMCCVLMYTDSRSTWRMHGVGRRANLSTPGHRPARAEANENVQPRPTCRLQHVPVLPEGKNTHVRV